MFDSTACAYYSHPLCLLVACARNDREPPMRPTCSRSTRHDFILILLTVSRLTICHVICTRAARKVSGTTRSLRATSRALSLAVNTAACRPHQNPPTERSSPISDGPKDARMTPQPGEQEQRMEMGTRAVQEAISQPSRIASRAMCRCGVVSGQMRRRRI